MLKMMTKTGAPTTAVTTPSGNSEGAMTVRAMVSAKTRNAAPKTTEIGRIRPIRRADEKPHDVRHDDADETDQPDGRHDGGRPERRRRDDDEADAAHRNTERARLVLTDAHHVERPSGADADADAHRHVGKHQRDRTPAGARE